MLQVFGDEKRYWLLPIFQGILLWVFSGFRLVKVIQEELCPSA